MSFLKHILVLYRKKKKKRMFQDSVIGMYRNHIQDFHSLLMRHHKEYGYYLHVLELVYSFYHTVENIIHS